MKRFFFVVSLALSVMAASAAGTVTFTPTQHVPAMYYDASGWEGFVSSTWTIQLVKDANNAIQMEFQTTNGSTILAGSYDVESDGDSGCKMNGIQADCLGGSLEITWVGEQDGFPTYRFNGTFIDANYTIYVYDVVLPVEAFNYQTRERITLTDGNSEPTFNPLDTLTNDRFEADALVSERFIFDQPDDRVIIDNQITEYGIVELTLAREEKGFNEGVVFDMIVTLNALDKNGNIPAGVYPIDYTDAVGHAYASTGYDYLGGPEPTYVMTRQNGFDQGLWCFVSGTVTVGYDTKGTIQVLAVGKNYFGFDIIVAYNTDAPQGIDDVRRDDVQCTKVIRDGQLYIMYEGTMYDVRGRRVDD